jgi:hypothetical protein
VTGAGCGKSSRFGVSAWREEYSLDVRSLLAIPARSGLQSPRCGRKNKKGNCAGVEREAVSRSERTWVVKPGKDCSNKNQKILKLKRAGRTLERIFPGAPR